MSIIFLFKKNNLEKRENKQILFNGVDNYKKREVAKLFYSLICTIKTIFVSLSTKEK